MLFTDTRLKEFKIIYANKIGFPFSHFMLSRPAFMQLTKILMLIHYLEDFSPKS